MASVDLNPSTTGIQNTFSSANGNYVVNAVGLVTYTPTTGFTGTATLSYTINDNLGLTSNVGTLTITVNGATNSAPSSIPDATSTAFNTLVNIDVLANDTDDVSLNAASVSVTVPSANGTTSVNTTTGIITFTPTSGFSGTTTFTYQVCDNGSPALCATAVVTVIVGVNSITEKTIISSVYPNPVNNILTIQTEGAIKSSTIVSLEGKVIGNYKSVNSINVESLTKGVYFLELTFENGLTSKSQFVKN